MHFFHFCVFYVFFFFSPIKKTFIMRLRVKGLTSVHTYYTKVWKSWVMNWLISGHILTVQDLTMNDRETKHCYSCKQLSMNEWSTCPWGWGEISLYHYHIYLNWQSMIIMSLIKPNKKLLNFFIFKLVATIVFFPYEIKEVSSYWWVQIIAEIVYKNIWR